MPLNPFNWVRFWTCPLVCCLPASSSLVLVPRLPVCPGPYRPCSPYGTFYHHILGFIAFTQLGSATVMTFIPSHEHLPRCFVLTAHYLNTTNLTTTPAPAPLTAILPCPLAANCPWRFLHFVQFTPVHYAYHLLIFRPTPLPTVDFTDLFCSSPSVHCRSYMPV